MLDIFVKNMVWVIYIVIIIEMLYFSVVFCLAGLGLVLMFTIDQQSPYDLDNLLDNDALFHMQLLVFISKI